MTAESYDFRNASRLGTELDRRLAGWLRAAAGMSARRWAPLLSFAAEMHVKDYQLVLPGPYLASWPEEAICLRVSWQWQPDVTTLVLITRPLALALLAGLMGEQVEAPLEDRPLTTVEESLCSYLVETLLLGLLRAAWPDGEPAPLVVGAREAEFRSTRLFPPTEPILAFTFRVTGPFGEGDWCWLLPRSDWVGRLLAPRQAVRSATGLADCRAQLTRLAEQFPVRLSVRLGKAEVSLQQLSRLQTGDLILLDQRVSEPLPASLAGTVKYHVWPGAVGSRQAIEIHSLLNGQ